MGFRAGSNQNRISYSDRDRAPTPPFVKNAASVGVVSQSGITQNANIVLSKAFKIIYYIQHAFWFLALIYFVCKSIQFIFSFKGNILILLFN